MMYYRDLSTFANRFTILEFMLPVLFEYVLIWPAPSAFPIVINVTNDITIVRKHRNTLAMQHS